MPKKRSGSELLCALLLFVCEAFAFAVGMWKRAPDEVRQQDATRLAFMLRRISEMTTALSVAASRPACFAAEIQLVQMSAYPGCHAADVRNNAEILQACIDWGNENGTK